MKMTELASLFTFAACVEHKKELPDQTKITSIMILFYGIFKKYLAFFKQNRKDNYVFVMIWRVLQMAEGKTEIIWWTWQKKWICTFRGEGRVKSKWFSTSTDLKEKIVISKKNKSCNTSSNDPALSEVAHYT